MPLPRHGTIILIGDFLAPEPETERHLRALVARGVRGHLLQVLDPAEASMPFEGRTRFRGMEAEGDLLVGRAETLRTDYLDRLEALQAGLDTFARAAGWTFAVHHTDRSPQPALLALYSAIAELPGTC